jgi:hypothetical protein
MSGMLRAAIAGLVAVLSLAGAGAPAQGGRVRRGVGGLTRSRAAAFQLVIAGLDPAIHPVRKASCEEDGCPDQVRA